jgi:hypothetical protein
LLTATSRGEKDEWTYEIIRTAFAAFADEVRKHDPDRAISTGDSAPRSCAWHNWQEKTWTADTPEQFAEMLVADNPDPVDLISIHAYEDGAPVIRAANEVARSVKKPLFVGEFGAPGPLEKSQAQFSDLLSAIEEAQVPLAAVWVYDHGDEDTFTITATNERAWQLQALSEANARIREQLGKETPAP